MKKIFLPAIVVLLMASCGDSKKETKNEAAATDTTKVTNAVYQCPMDCEKGKTYDKPGQCPVCGMDLEIKS